MNDEEKIVSYETLNHIRVVGNYLGKVVIELIRRLMRHDDTKLRQPELEAFVEFTPKLENSSYGSEEYQQFLNGMREALTHHYCSHRHHPEHFENSIDDMNLIDLLEMVCDWKAATMRHKNGDVDRSIEISKDRFNISDQLERILRNTNEFINGL